MEGFVFLLIIGLLFLVLILMKKINRVDEKLNSINGQLKNISFLISKDQVKEKVEPQHRTVPQEQPIIKPEVIVPEVKREPVQQEVVIEKKELIPQVTPRMAVSVPSAPKKIIPPKPSFMERNPDLEKFIGENLLSKIGIVIFVIGMGFLVKLGIDNDVITESMRVVIGVLIGGGMIGLAHYLRKSFANFSSVLIGGALSVLYFTIALAFHEYALIPQTAAFVIMMVITAFGVLLSIAYNRKTLAVLAMIGGFGTPFFISTGSGNFVVLLSYVLILDIGMLTLAYFKKWNIINYLTYGFSYLLFAGVYYSKFIGNEDATRFSLFLFLTAYYLIFFLMNIIYNVKNGSKFKFPEISMLLSNSAIYFGLGLSLVHGYKNGLYSGLFTALIAVFNFTFTYTLYKRKNIDTNLLYLLIGLVLTFVSLIAPIQLKGNQITLFWAIEVVLLLWLSKKSGIAIMKLAALLISGLMLISLVMDWQQNYYPTGEYVILNVFINKAFITSFAVILSLIGVSYLMNDVEKIEVKDFQIVIKKIPVKGLLGLLTYIGFAFELNYQFVRFEFDDTFRLILLGIYNYIFVILLLIRNWMKPSVLLSKIAFVLSGVVVGSYLTVYLYQITKARNYYLMSDHSSNTGYHWHYVLLFLFLLILVHLYRQVFLTYGFKSEKGIVALWIMSFIAVVTSSVEIGHFSMIYQSDSVLTNDQMYGIAVKSVYPVVWALTALILMILGMKFRLKTLRLSSLVLFSITIIKLFFYDLAGNATGKIVSFILLGVILLVISFLYQKLKFIIQDDEKKI